MNKDMSRSHQCFFIALTLFAACFFALSGFAVYRISAGDVVETNILALLPQGKESDLVHYADQKISNRFERRIVLFVGDVSAEKASAAAKKIQTDIDNTKLFSAFKAENQSDQMRSLTDFYDGHRASFLTAQQKKWLEQGDAKAIRAAALSQLYGVSMPLVSAGIQHDPFSFLNTYVAKAMDQTIGDFTVVNDIPIVLSDGVYYAVLSIDLAGNPFALSYQNEVVDALDQIQNAATAKNSELSFIRSGLIFHARNGAETAKSEMSMMGTLSLTGVFLLLLLVFKSLRPFIVISLSIACAGFVGFAACLLFFAKVHLLTLVFGTSLLGISIDYALHFWAERYKQEPWNARDAVRSIFPSISFGLLTSIIGFLGLCFTPIISLQQMAIFSIAGLIFVYGCVVFIYPVLFASVPRTPAAWIYDGAQKYLHWWNKRRERNILRIMFALIFILVCALPFLEGKDDIRVMQSLSPQLIANDMNAAKILGSPISTQMFIVRGADNEAMLQTMEDLSQRLDDLTQTGGIDGYMALSNFVQSQHTQTANISLLHDFVKNHEAAVKSLFSEMMLDENAYARYLAFLSAAQTQHYTLPQFLDAANRDELWMLYDENYHGQTLGFVTLKHAVNIDALARIANEMPQVEFIDKVASLSSLLDRYRYWAGILAIVAYVVIFMVLALRYGLMLGAAILVPSIAASFLTLVIVALLGGSYSLFHVLALFLLMGVGVDYGLFLVESARDKNATHITRAMTAIILSALTTLLSFGLLTTSSTSALHDFGMTVLIGITITFILSPIVLMGIKKEERV